MNEQWNIGDRLYDANYRKCGTVIDVGDYDGFVVVFVHWDDGSMSDFTPDENTRKVETWRE